MLCILQQLFIRKVAEEYGDDSIKATFRLDNVTGDHWLEYLLRCYKESFFRKYYPSISVV
jgi:hypothetical protein